MLRSLLDNCRGWSAVQDVGISVYVGDEQKDLDALKEDVEELGEQHKSLVHF